MLKIRAILLFVVVVATWQHHVSLRQPLAILQCVRIVGQGTNSVACHTPCDPLDNYIGTSGCTFNRWLIVDGNSPSHLDVSSNPTLTINENLVSVIFEPETTKNILSVHVSAF